MPVSVLGVGWGFPVVLDERPDGRAARFTVAEYEEAMRQSIWIILSTAKGERVMRPDFGSSLNDLAFAVNNSTTQAMAAFEVREALQNWEPRIEVLGVDVSSAGDRGEQ